jgi:hypothetical protein
LTVQVPATHIVMSCWSFSLVHLHVVSVGEHSESARALAKHFVYQTSQSDDDCRE